MASYYVDYASGVDTNNGTSTLTPWKHHPLDADASDTADGTTLVAGDIVYFKGGVTYAGALNLSIAGSSGSPISIISGHELSTPWGTGHALISSARIYTGVLVVSAAYNSILGCNVINTGSLANEADGIRGESSYFVFERGIIKGGRYGYFNNGGTYVSISAFQISACGSHGYYISYGGPHYIYNGSVVGNGGSGISCNGYAVSHVKNCYAGGNTAADYAKDENSTINFTTSYSEDESLTTPAAAYSDSTGAFFANVGAGTEDCHIDPTSDLVGVGTDLSSDGSYPITYDIDHVEFSGWDVGCDQSTATYAVTYDGNGNTGGTVPTDASSPYEESNTVTVLGNTGSLVKTGYSFVNWNTAADGTGTDYDPDDTFAMPAAAVTLYAQWSHTAVRYYVDFVAGDDTNNGTSTSTPFKHAPGVPEATDTAASCVLHEGDRVSFKGGVVYAGEVIIYSSGTLGNEIIYDGNYDGDYGTGRAEIDAEDTRDHGITDGDISRSNIIIRGFEIYDTDPLDADNAHGIGIYSNTSATNVQIIDCDIHDTGADCINIAGVVSAVQIVGNALYNGNADGIKGVFAGASLISGNTVYGFESATNHGDGMQVRPYNGTSVLTIRNNIVHTCTQMIYVDVWDGTDHGRVDIYGNVVYFTGSTYYNGIVIDTENDASFFTEINVYHNTVVNCDQGSGGIRVVDRGGGVVTLRVKNNLFYNSAEAITAARVTSLDVDYNLWTDSDQAAEEAHGQYWSSGTGLFTNYAGYNFRLVSNTDAGADLGSTYTPDSDSVVRSTNSRGAFEYVSGSTEYNETLSETINLSESLSNTNTISITLTDTMNFSESESNTKTISETLSETVNFSESETEIKTISELISDIINLSESITKTIEITVSLSDGITIIESLSSHAEYSLTLSDTIRMSDLLSVITNGVIKLRISVAEKRIYIDAVESSVKIKVEEV